MYRKYTRFRRKKFLTLLFLGVTSHVLCCLLFFWLDLTCFMFLLSPTTFCCVVWRASTVWRQSLQKITRFMRRASTLPQMTRNTRFTRRASTLLIRFARHVLFITRAVHETCFCCRSCNGRFFLVSFCPVLILPLGKWVSQGISGLSRVSLLGFHLKFSKLPPWHLYPLIESFSL